MTEKQFEPDCEEDCHNNQYDYSILNSRYEANTERNEIIEWNKDSCNVQYVGLERIAEKLNFKQMQLEECRKGYEKLCEENEQLKSICQDHKDHAMDFKADCGRLEKENDELKKENNNLKKALWEAEENYLYEAYYDNSARREDKLQNLKEDFKREYWND